MQAITSKQANEMKPSETPTISQSPSGIESEVGAI